MDNLEIIILAAGIGKRMKSYGPKCLLDLGSQSILLRQVDILRVRFPKAKIKVIAGFDHDKVLRHVVDNHMYGVKVYCNNDYLTEGSSQAIVKWHDYDKNLLVVNGDLVFNKEFLDVDFVDSGILYGKKFIGKTELGFSDIDGYVGRFSYIFTEKWGQIVYFTKQYASVFCQIASKEKNKNLLNFEIFNRMIDDGCMLKCYKPKGGKVVDVDRPNDLLKVKKI